MQTNQQNLVSIWGNAVSIAENRPASYAKDITLRYPIHVQISGDAVNITYDNYCGTEDITIAKSTLLVGEHFLPLTFNGKASITIPAGSCATSDLYLANVQAGETIYVSFYLADFTQMRSCVYTCGQYSDDALWATGDQTESHEISIDDSLPTHYFYFLSNVAVRAKKPAHTVVCYGDSITAQNWPDDLARICEDAGMDDTAIIRRATSGSRILREYSCLKYASYGLKGSKRFHHEVPTMGADVVIIQQGINDIIHPVGSEVNPFRPMRDLPTAEKLIEGLRQYIAQAKSYGYKVYVGTLLPIKGWRTYAPFREELKNEVNEWIRTSDEIDGCIDFAKAVEDPADPTAFLPVCDSGDHLHPSKEGYRRMAQAVPLEILKCQSSDEAEDLDAVFGEHTA